MATTIKPDALAAAQEYVRQNPVPVIAEHRPEMDVKAFLAGWEAAQKIRKRWWQFWR